ncbi:MAG TPA: DUF1080 domain-containing protein [Vicinamibacterales bacterium]|nr:DUF1080 domain-containing protein [Vicinamibacterales bacterium]
MRLQTGLLLALVAAAAAVPLGAQDDSAQPFLGAWNLTGDAPNDTFVYWLEVKNEGGKLSAMFLNRGGSPVPAVDPRITNGELTFSIASNAPTKPAVSLRRSGDALVGTVTAAQTVKVTGGRPPQWGPCDANAKHTFGKPVPLFDGTSMAGWDVQHKSRESGWSIEDGAMTNVPKANNLISKERFKDFRLDVEYKVSPKGNSGIYLRGRYELQVLDDAGTAPESHGHMAIYARKAPDANASKPAGEWQTAQITLVGNCVTVVLNGKTVHDNARIPAITGGALDAKEAEPGPIMIQGDHEKVWYRKVVVTPITGSASGSR